MSKLANIRPRMIRVAAREPYVTLLRTVPEAQFRAVQAYLDHYVEGVRAKCRARAVALKLPR